MYKLIRPLLFGLSKDPETVHHLALAFLKLADRPIVSSFIHSLTKTTNPALEQKFFGLNFKNPIGLAAGFDKEAKAVLGLEAVDFGFLEVGTASRYAQTGNPKPRLFRLDKDLALINRMGFNSQGAEALAKTLAGVNLKIPVGVSIGKTKVVPLEQAAGDYAGSFATLYNHGDFFVINVSSPNTPNLRKLAEKNYLIEIITALQKYRSTQKVYKHILIKTVIDFSLEAIDEMLQVCSDYKIDGIICSNTSIARENLKIQINEGGGLSGAPIKQKSTEYVRYIHKQAHPCLSLASAEYLPPRTPTKKLKPAPHCCKFIPVLFTKGR